MINLFYDFGIIWIKSNGSFLITNKQTNRYTHTTSGNKSRNKLPYRDRKRPWNMQQMKTVRKNLATFQLKHLVCNFIATNPLFKEFIFQPILHLFQSNIVYYTSRARIDLLCEFGVIWIKSDGAFHSQTNKQTNKQTHTYIHTDIHKYNIRQNYSQIIIFLL